jgi:hypothetical protein
MSAIAHEPQPALEGESPRGLSLVDCDAHHNWRGVKDVLPYLPRYWADYVVESQFKSLPETSAPPDQTSSSSAVSCSTSGESTSRFSPDSSTTWLFWPTPGLPRRCRARSMTG